MDKSTKIRQFQMLDWSAVVEFWKSLKFYTPFDRKWIYEKKVKDCPDLFLIAERDGKIVATAIASYDIQFSYVRFLIKEGVEEIGRKLLDKLISNLKKRGTFAVFLTPHKNRKCEEAFKSCKPEGFFKTGNAEYWVKFLSKKTDFK